jgi:hypothetical protein
MHLAFLHQAVVHPGNTENAMLGIQELSLTLHVIIKYWPMQKL